MAVDLNREKANTGELVFAWNIKEYEQHDRSRRWYITAGVIGGLLLLFSVISGNYLFALVVVLFGIILFLQDMQPPQDVFFGITEAGIIIGSRYYTFKEFTGFWIIYNPPEVKNIYLATKYLLKRRIQIPLLDNDPLPIRDFLNQFILEDLEKEEEPLSDRIRRAFQIH